MDDRHDHDGVDGRRLEDLGWWKMGSRMRRGQVRRICRMLGGPGIEERDFFRVGQAWVYFGRRERVENVKGMEFGKGLWAGG